MATMFGGVNDNSATQKLLNDLRSQIGQLKADQNRSTGDSGNAKGTDASGAKAAEQKKAAAALGWASTASPGFMSADDPFYIQVDAAMGDVYKAVNLVNAKRETLLKRVPGDPSHTARAEDIRELDGEIQTVTARITGIVTNLAELRRKVNSPAERFGVVDYNRGVATAKDDLMMLQVDQIAALIRKASRPVDPGTVVDGVETARIVEMSSFDYDGTTGDAVLRRYEELVARATALAAKVTLPQGYQETFEAAKANYKAAKAAAAAVLNAPGGNHLDYIRARMRFGNDVAALKEDIVRFADAFERQLKAALTFKGFCPGQPDAEKDLSRFITKDIPQLIASLLEAIDSASSLVASSTAALRKSVGAQGSAKITTELESLKTKLSDNKYAQESQEVIKNANLNRGNNGTYQSAVTKLQQLRRTEEELRKKILEIESKTKVVSKSIGSIPNSALYDQGIATIRAAALSYSKEVLEKSEKIKAKLECSRSESDEDNYKDLLDALMNRYTDSVYIHLLSSSVGKSLSEDASILATAGDGGVAGQTSLSYIYSSVNTSFATIRRGVFETHTSVADAVGKHATAWDSFNSDEAGVVYMFKVARIGTAALAAYVATKTFQKHYVFAMSRRSRTGPAYLPSGEPNPDASPPPDLKWFAGTFVLFDAIFNAILLLAAWFVLKLALGDKGQGVFYDLLFDTLIGMALTAASVLWICDIVQDKRYFEYRSAIPRAMRVVRQITTVVAAAHALVPYFFLVGPFNLLKRKRALGGASAGAGDGAGPGAGVDPATGVSLSIPDPGQAEDNAKAALRILRSVPENTGPKTTSPEAGRGDAEAAAAAAEAGKGKGKGEAEKAVAAEKSAEEKAAAAAEDKAVEEKAAAAEKADDKAVAPKSGQKTPLGIGVQARSREPEPPEKLLGSRPLPGAAKPPGPVPTPQAQGQGQAQGPGRGKPRGKGR